jgi:hypothetical protein
MINLKTFTDLPRGRYGHVCGILRDRSGNPKKVVVAGGFGRVGVWTEPEIFDLELGVWSQGPPVAVVAAGKYSNELEVSNV